MRSRDKKKPNRWPIKIEKFNNVTQIKKNNTKEANDDDDDEKNERRMKKESE